MWDSYNNGDYPNVTPSDITFCIASEPNPDCPDDYVIYFLPKWDYNDNGEGPAYDLIDKYLPEDEILNAMEWVWAFTYVPEIEDINKVKQTLLDAGFIYDKMANSDDDYYIYY